ncbi:MAG: ion transporter [Planctomycetaceae bacterium]|nr:ion transporter [Planctomycetaceae bacterium]
MTPTLQEIVEDTNTPQGRVFAYFIQSLIVLSLIAFSIETLPNLSPAVRSGLTTFEYVSVAIFTVEYLLRTFIATSKTGYIFSFFGILDLLAILPFYVGLSVDLRSLRAFRLLRLFRIMKLVRYSAAMRRFHVALTIAKEELILFVCVTAILLFLAAVGIHHFESQAQPEQFGSIFHCLWWAVVTLTTVGYGDAYPITVGGRVFTFAILLVGLGVISVPAGLVASALAKARQLEDQERLESPVEKP